MPTSIYDVCVIGAGAAGGIVTKELCEGGAKVILLATGAEVKPFAETGWVKDGAGEKLHYPIDHYPEDRVMWVEYRGIRVVNYRRPMSRYFRALLGAGLQMTWFDEPAPGAELRTAKAKSYCRYPGFW